MILSEKILRLTQELPEGEVVTPSTFIHLGTRRAVQRSLSRLVLGGKLFRVARGFYVAAVYGRFGVRSPAPVLVVRSLEKVLGELIVITGASAANNLGLTTQNPVRYVFLTTGRSRELQVGKAIVTIRHAPSWMMALGATKAGDALRALEWLGPVFAADVLPRLHELLPDSEWVTLVEAKNSYPAWIESALRAHLASA